MQSNNCAINSDYGDIYSDTKGQWSIITSDCTAYHRKTGDKSRVSVFLGKRKTRKKKDYLISAFE